ncbi:hypothetical protein ACNOYE_01050 [Nannocystaceae bacterium ST9]
MQRLTHTTKQTDLRGESWMFGLPSQMQLVVEWGGRTRVFEVIEFALDEIVVVDFEVEGLDLCHHDATLDFCDGELLDEVHCRVAFRGFEAEGVARLRVVALGWELMELARLGEQLRQRTVGERMIDQARVAAACGWI